MARHVRRVFVLLALAAAAGCGVPQELFDARTTELDRCREETSRAQSALTVTRRGLDEAAAKREEYREQSERLSREKEQLGNGATPQELEELRRARVQAGARAQLFKSLEERLHDLVQTRLADVTVRKGRMVVRLADTLLFDAQTGALSPAGQSALRQLGSLLREISDRDFLVVGHTDNQPVRGRSNWDVSTAHAVAVVRFFQGEGVDPRHLAAAGASEFDAVAANEAPDLRALNRRVEIWVMPATNELPAVTSATVVPMTLPPPPPPPLAPTATTSPATNSPAGSTTPPSGPPAPATRAAPKPPPPAPPKP